MNLAVSGEPESDSFEAIILGAGISGLVSASMLVRQGYKRILVVDEYDHIGGNHIDHAAGGYTFDVGSLIFQDDSPLLDHFPELLPLYVPIKPKWARLTPQGKVSAYPISVRDDILGAGLFGLGRIIFSLVYARVFQRRMRNAKEFARFWIGSYLLDRSGLQSYMKRFYGIGADEIDIELARKRMLWISEHASLGNVARRIFKARKDAPPRNRQMARPRAGFANLYDEAAKRLNRHGVSIKLSAEMLSLRKVNDRFHLHLKDKTIVADRLISTIPIPRAELLCGINSIHPLETITLISLYFSFSGSRGFAEAIIYNFSHDGAWKRLTVYSDFYGQVDGREYFTAEVIADPGNRSPEQAESNFRTHIARNGLFDGDLRLEASHILENAYPIYKRGAARHAADAAQTLRAFGVESHGRQGGFNYQPTARTSTIEAEAALCS
jgi:protoporphyrinogen oxidase